MPFEYILVKQIQNPFYTLGRNAFFFDFLLPKFLFQMQTEHFFYRIVIGQGIAVFLSGMQLGGRGFPDAVSGMISLRLLMRRAMS